MEKKRRIPRNMDCLLTKKERTALCKILDNWEWSAYAPYKHTSFAYSEAKVVEYDEEEIEVEIMWGVDGDWHEKDEFTINRETL